MKIFAGSLIQDLSTFYSLFFLRKVNRKILHLLLKLETVVLPCVFMLKTKFSRIKMTGRFIVSRKLKIKKNKRLNQNFDNTIRSKKKKKYEYV